MGVVSFFTKPYSNKEYLIHQRARGLVIVNIAGLLLSLFYIFSNYLSGGIKEDAFSHLVIPLIFMVVLVISLVIIKTGHLEFAGNFTITGLILVQIFAIFINVSRGNRFSITYAGTFYYFLLLLSFGSLYSSKLMITINTALLVLASVAVLIIAQHTYPQQLQQDITTSTIDFIVNILAMYVFLIFAKKILLQAMNILIQEKTEKERQNRALTQILEQMQNTINQLQQASEKFVTLADELNYRSQEQAATTEQVAASTQQINAAIENTSFIANKTHKITISATKDINEANDVLNSTIETFLKISQNIEIITNIAEKTDILAINAAIEAAHAGQYGAGFAIVAQEIRKLSDLAKTASAKISELSSSAQKQAVITKEKFKQIVDNISNIAQFMENIATASQDQLQSINQITSSSSQLSTFAEENSKIANELVIYAHKLSELSKNLQNFVNKKFFKQL